MFTSFANSSSFAEKCACVKNHARIIQDDKDAFLTWLFRPWVATDGWWWCSSIDNDDDHNFFIWLGAWEGGLLVKSRHGTVCRRLCCLGRWVTWWRSEHLSLSTLLVCFQSWLCDAVKLKRLHYWSGCAIVYAVTGNLLLASLKLKIRKNFTVSSVYASLIEPQMSHFMFTVTPQIHALFTIIAGAC